MIELTKKQALMEKLIKHNYDTFRHSERVAKLSRGFGEYLGLNEESLSVLHEAAEFHDIGKLKISSYILTKKQRLNEKEFIKILNHPIYSEEILREEGFSDEVLKIVRAHHENYDGSGYPYKLTHEHIPLHAAIIRIADSYDSMVSVRPYGTVKTKEEAIEDILSLKEKSYSPDLADKFSEYMNKTEFIS